MIITTLALARMRPSSSINMVSLPLVSLSPSGTRIKMQKLAPGLRRSRPSDLITAIMYQVEYTRVDKIGWSRLQPVVLTPTPISIPRSNFAPFLSTTSKPTFVRLLYPLSPLPSPFSLSLALSLSFLLSNSCWR